MDLSIHYRERRENSKSLAQDEIAQEIYAMLESQVWQSQSMERLKQYKAQSGRIEIYF